ncbi:hypothetical protein [Arthrobacter sp. A5]|uniref:hypothetical protein n=1 Tax=Arthrobacter sp. A5 TaxID=576926 RepID=UPI003DA81CE3
MRDNGDRSPSGEAGASDRTGADSVSVAAERPVVRWRPGFGWIVRHPLQAGWVWVGFWVALIVLDEFMDLAGWAWYVFVGLAALPTLVATIAVLHATPRKYLKTVSETVLNHFFVRFLALVTAFVIWGVSVVMSASISTTIQSVVGDTEREVTAFGFHLLLATFPLVVSVLWLAFIIRCAWFLRRLRGWREHPARSKVPKKFLRSRPQLRGVVIGLAHPGLLLVAGLGTSILALVVNAVDLTLNVIV